MLEGTALESSILDWHGSDHWPIQLWLKVPATPGRKPFRFEQFWLSHPDFHNKIQAWWREAEVPHGSKMYRFQQRLKNLKKQLRLWNRQTFGNIFDSQKQLIEQMSMTQRKICEHVLTEDLKAQKEDIKQRLEVRKSQ